MEFSYFKVSDAQEKKINANLVSCILYLLILSVYAVWHFIQIINSLFFEMTEPILMNLHTHTGLKSYYIFETFIKQKKTPIIWSAIFCIECRYL